METLLKEIVSCLLGFNYSNGAFLASLLRLAYPTRNEPLYYHGLCVFYEQKYAAVVSLLSQNTNEEYAPIVYLLAQAYFALEQYSLAEHALKRVLALLSETAKNEVEPSLLDPHASLSLAQVHAFLGRVQRRVNRSQDATASFKESLKLNPTLWSSFQELCQLGEMKDMGDYFSNDGLASWFSKNTALEIHENDAHIKSKSLAKNLQAPQLKRKSSKVSVYCPSKGSPPRHYPLYEKEREMYLHIPLPPSHW